jgi:hypothetical protein
MVMSCAFCVSDGGITVTFVQIRPTPHYFVLIPTILWSEDAEVTGHLLLLKDLNESLELHAYIYW